MAQVRSLVQGTSAFLHAEGVAKKEREGKERKGKERKGKERKIVNVLKNKILT